MGSFKSKELLEPTDLFNAVVKLADDEKQFNAAFFKYYYISIKLVKKLPYGTSIDVKEQKIKEMLNKQTDIFQLIKAFLYSIEKDKITSVINSEIKNVILSDGKTYTNTKKWVVEKLTIHLMDHTEYGPYQNSLFFKSSTPSELLRS